MYFKLSANLAQAPTSEDLNVVAPTLVTPFRLYVSNAQEHKTLRSARTHLRGVGIFPDRGNSDPVLSGHYSDRSAIWLSIPTQIRTVWLMTGSDRSVKSGSGGADPRAFCSLRIKRWGNHRQKPFGAQWCAVVKLKQTIFTKKRYLFVHMMMI